MKRKGHEDSPLISFAEGLNEHEARSAALKVNDTDVLPANAARGIAVPFSHRFRSNQ
jgi:hypothetical protein